MGRYYAMDRDKRWERVQIAYDALFLSKGEKSSDPMKVLNIFLILVLKFEVN